MNENLEKEIFELTVQRDKAKEELANQSNGFGDIELFEKVAEIEKKLQEKINQRNK